MTVPNGTNGTNGHSADAAPTSYDDLDVVLVGAGFGGTLMLWRLRQAGFKARLIERNSRPGGVWSWNHYPGARVDSDVPTFEFSDPELWNDWKWTERFPGQPEILTYFDYVTKKLKLDESTSYNTSVNSANWDDETKWWTIGSEQGATFKTRRVVWCTGYFTKRFVPAIEGLDSFKGTVLHPGAWPVGGVDLAGKSVGIIGTGASAVQLIQDIAPLVKDLTIFQRTPNTALPMVQRKLPPRGHDKAEYPGAFRYRVGGFSFYLGSYNDVMTSIESNHIAYEYWRRKVWERINDKSVAALLAPLKPLHSFGAKRPCLEQRYYEVFNQSNVKLVDVRSNPIEKITPTGVQTAAGINEVEVLITATGYDAVIGSYKDVNICGKDGKLLYEDGWANGSVKTYLGLMTSGFPNSHYIFGPQSPFANGPTCVEVQTEALMELFNFMREKGYNSCESTPAADLSYKKEVNEAAAATVAGWFWGTNVPGGRNEVQIYMKGIPAYKERVDEEKNAGYPNMTFTA
ncbi:hypothetical protein RQP46_009439 [Phenoliferia psychrophenolica]